ncbi:DAK2 domain-containing protein [Desulfofalx alkaliphila]|uniref:DAK2 domain-containing protein n=1 Tax=Desulfofalx alkaliphila TaxID=105483 RepID=UPI0004E1669F|nr:DAK2 domain-containing protein [Desulfofalx alkaliphila]
MSIYSLDGAGLKRMLMGSINLLATSKQEIDALNVFPVPDGDTGTNMYLTFLEAAKEIQAAKTSHVGEIMEAAARGCLMGARGNSGVILSQVVRGFANSLKGKSTATAKDMAKAFAEGTNLAYQAVAQPVEGTVLTVLRKSSEAAQQAADRSPDLLRFMITVYRQAARALDETPEQLAVLKEAGVVDAGGKGWVIILQGILYALRRVEEIELLQDFASSQKKRLAEFTLKEIDSDIHYTYCTEFILKGTDLPIEKIKNELSPYGDCLMVVGSDQVLKVHIHSNHPGLVIETCLNYGTLHQMNISNMREQNLSLEKGQADKPLAVVSVAVGEGIIKIMESLGVDKVITGGQTMNPSTEEILQAIEKAPSQNIIVLPNNKNIVLAAKQAALMTEKSVEVVNTVSIPQGLTALLSLNPEGTLEENADRMQEALKLVRTGEVTTAVRNVSINGQAIKEGNIIGLADEQIVAFGNDTYLVLKQLMEKLTSGGEELITLYYGEDQNGESARQTAEMLQRDFPNLEFEVHYGGQPLYPYIISAE